jgi:D-alanyl-D-alanine carboxypeptidase/D-alanyl-D-alanine-endopeptidase (penicillin-binding protein 4)
MEVKQWLKESGIDFSGKVVTNSQLEIEGKPILQAPKIILFLLSIADIR